MRHDAHYSGSTTEQCHAQADEAMYEQDRERRERFGETPAPKGHTPGPWACNREGYVTACGQVVAQMGAVGDPDEAVSNGFLVEAAPDLLREAKETRDLCMLLTTVALTPAVEDHLPYGTLERVKAWIQKHDGIDAAIRKAERKVSK